MTASTLSPARPSRGRKKGFVPGSWSSRYYQGIIDTFTELQCTTLTLGELAFWLHAHGGWLKRPLARLVENGVIVETPHMTLEYGGVVRTKVYYSLVQTEGQAPADEPITWDTDCRACEQVGAGRGSCASCSRS